MVAQSAVKVMQDALARWGRLGTQWERVMIGDGGH